MKKTAIILAAMLIFCIAFCACTKLPEEPATTAVSNYLVDEDLGEDLTSPAPVIEGESTTKAETTESYTKALAADLDIVTADYYIYGKSYGSIENIHLMNYGLNTIEGYVDVNLTGISFGETQFRIGCIMYDATGNEVKTTFILADLDANGYKEGDTAECRFDVPAGLGIVKVAFVDYAEVGDKISV